MMLEAGPDKPGKPELLLSMHYEDVTGRLQILVVKGVNFRTPEMKIEPGKY